MADLVDKTYLSEQNKKHAEFLKKIAALTESQRVYIIQLLESLKINEFEYLTERHRKLLQTERAPTPEAMCIRPN